MRCSHGTYECFPCRRDRLVSEAISDDWKRYRETDEQSERTLLCQTDAGAVHAVEDEDGDILATTATVANRDVLGVLRCVLGFEEIPDTYCQTIAVRITT